MKNGYGIITQYTGKDNGSCALPFL